MNKLKIINRILVNKIQHLVRRISKRIISKNPINLMDFLVMNDLMNKINIKSEIEGDARALADSHAIEYVQSILVSLELSQKRKQDNEKGYTKILKDIRKLYNYITEYIIIWSLIEKDRKDSKLSLDDISYIIESHLMGNTRGVMYQCHQIDILYSLIRPHNEIFKKLFDLTVDEFMLGIKAIGNSIVHGKIDEYRKIAQIYKEFIGINPKELESKSISEIMDQLSKKYNININILQGTEAYDVKKITGWNDKIIDAFSLNIGKNSDFLEDKLYGGWPIQNLPILYKPFIKIGGKSFCFDYYNLFDNLYRSTQKNIKELDNTYTTKWAEIQKEASEAEVEKLFKRLLPACTTYIGNYYPKKKSLKQMDENDLIVIYENVLFVIEVKAGSFTYTSSIFDYTAHKKSFNNLIGEADSLCERTVSYLKNNKNANIYTEDKKIKGTINYEDFSYVFTLNVTIDNFNHFESKIEKLHFLSLYPGSIAIAFQELWVYADYFNNPIKFVHYIIERQKATYIKELYCFDELDHLGMYIDHQLYTIYVNENVSQGMFVPIGYREKLDNYFNSKGRLENAETKPERKLPERIEEIFELSKKLKYKYKLDYCLKLLDLDDNSLKTCNDSINQLLSSSEEKIVPFGLQGEQTFIYFVLPIRYISYKIDSFIQHAYEIMRKNSIKESFLINLYYDSTHRLINMNVEYLS